MNCRRYRPRALSWRMAQLRRRRLPLAWWDMRPQTPPPPPPPPRGSRGPGAGGRVGGGAMSSIPRWTLWVLVGVAAAAFLLTTFGGGSTGPELQYSQFLDQVQHENVKSIDWN